MDWTHVITVFAIMATNLGTVIVLFCHLDNKTDKTISAMREESNATLRAIQIEMKDFHGRLCAIEERNKK